MKFKLLFLVVYLAIENVLCIETNILEYLKKQDQTNLIIAEEFMNIFRSDKYFNGQKFTCLTMLPTNFTVQKKQPIHKLNLTFNYKHEQNIKETKYPSQQKQVEDKKIVGYRYDHDYDKILDLLHGTCVVHQTNQFLYEYCHKEKVRQFDDVYTRQRMAKPQFEDIAMGYYNYQSALQKSTSPHDKGLKPGNSMYQIKYSQNGDLKILNKLLQNVPQLTLQQKQLLKKTVAETLQINTQSQDNHNTKSETLKSSQNSKESAVKGIQIKPLPTRSSIYDQKNLFTVQTVNHREYDLNKENKIIHLNYPIVKSNRYFVLSQIAYEVICANKNSTNNSTNKMGIYVSKAIVVSSFQLRFLGQIQKCDDVKQISVRPLQEKPYGEPTYMNRVRVVEDIVYGYVNDFCANNWDWQIEKSQNDKFSYPKDNYLEAGSTLWLQVAVNSTSNGGRVVFHHYPVTVKEVISNGVIQMNQIIFDRIKSIKKSSGAKANSSENDSVWISSCRIISKKPLNKQYYTTEKQIINRNIIKIKQLPNKNVNDKNNNSPNILGLKNPGDQMICLCRFRKYGEHFLEMNLMLGKRLFEANQLNNYFSYFEFYEKRRSVKTYKENDPDLYTLCMSNLMCYELEKKQVDNNGKSDSDKINQQGFTKIISLTQKQKTLTQGMDIDNKILILQTSEQGMIKLHTSTPQGDQFYYLISPSILIKYRTYSNGTKQVYKENSFYQNQTSLYFSSWFSTSIYIHKGFIWRGNDKIIFPRIKMLTDESITMIETIVGNGYVRIWDLQKMQNKESNMISNVQKLFNEHYQMAKVPIFQDQNKDVKVDGQVMKQFQEVKTQNNQKSTIDDMQSPAQADLHEPNIHDSIPYFKPLTKSVSVRYQYFHGDYCSHPINKYRRTNVNLQCGEAWMKIEQVKQTSPCVYEMVVTTKLLCRQSYEKMVSRVQNLIKNDARVKLQKSIVCYPEDAWDDALFIYDVQNKDIEFNSK